MVNKNLKLSKKCCKMCSIANWNSQWTADDEKNWKKGTVACWISYNNTNSEDWYISIYELPPDDCPFYLEHALEMQK